MAWRRLPSPVDSTMVEPVEPEAPKPKPKRRTKAERLNDAILAEQLANQEREKVLEQGRRALKAAWEANRPRESVGMDYSRFTF